MTWILVFDLLAYAAALALILRQPPLAALLRQLQPARRLLLLVLILAIPAGQVIHRSELTYPWVAWAMYTESYSGDVAYLDYSLVLADGSEVELPVVHMFNRIGKKVLSQLRRLEQADSLALCDRILLDLGHRFNREHPENPAVSIRIWDSVIPMAAHPPHAPARRTPRRSINL